MEKGGSNIGINRLEPKNDLLANLPPVIDPLDSLGIDVGLLDGGGDDLLELGNLLDRESEDFISKRRLDLGEDDDEEDPAVIDAVKSLQQRKKRPKSLPSSKLKGNDVPDLADFSGLGDLSSLLVMLTSESNNKEVQV